MRELLISKVLTPKKWPLGVDFFENNFKNLKALLKNILHVKGSEVILDFKGNLPSATHQSTEAASAKAASACKTRNITLPSLNLKPKTTAAAHCCPLLSVKSNGACIRVLA